MANKLISEATKEQRYLGRLEMAMRIARAHGKGKVFLTEEGITRISEIIMKEPVK
ncbi:hypothetical protein BhaS171_00031 [Bacillus phage vB_BhaS-171]|uniref:hypothetical protein n=1 Tax=Bacillus phage vB_BhaS-171 TaxID=1775140 RepID=UPI00074490E0|nr:hypothetical protein BH781_gp31 [Bacillus phage vB_BhaS-171]ALY08087.1 hypothetical protein BhaS171_00031 [Bacillus phage vB_BhaS-171]